MFQNIPIWKSSEREEVDQEKKMNKCDIQFFRLRTDAEDLQLLSYHSQPLRENEIYILINDVIKKVFLWIGSTVSVRSRFIGARSANLIQRNKGIDYRVVSVQQRDEPPEFHHTLSLIELK